MVSDAIAMVAEDRDVNRILNSLFEESGAEIYIRPAGHYIPDGAHLSFFDVAAACRARDEPETLVGFRRTGDDRAVVNPPDKSTKRVWDYYDMLVVLAEDERSNLTLSIYGARGRCSGCSPRAHGRTHAHLRGRSALRRVAASGLHRRGGRGRIGNGRRDRRRLRRVRRGCLLVRELVVVLVLAHALGQGARRGHAALGEVLVAAPVVLDAFLPRGEDLAARARAHVGAEAAVLFFLCLCCVARRCGLWCWRLVSRLRCGGLVLARLQRAKTSLQSCRARTNAYCRRPGEP